MSQATATTSTPPVTVVCGSALSLTMTATMASILMGLSVTSDQNDVVPTPPLMQIDTRGVVSLDLCCGSNLSSRCLLGHVPVMPWVLHR